MLQFDAPFDLARGRVGRLISGRLVGKVTVRSDQQNAGAEDDLRIDARDIDHESTPAQYAVRERPDVARYLASRGCWTDILMAAALASQSGGSELGAASVVASPTRRSS